MTKLRCTLEARYNYGFKCCLTFQEMIAKYSPGWDFYIFFEGYNSIDSVFTALFTWIECSPPKMLGTRTVQICFDLDMYVTFKLNIPNQSIWNPKGSRIWNVWPSLLFKSSFSSILFLWLIFCCHPIFLISRQIYFFCVWQLHLILQAVNDPYLYLATVIELHRKIMASNFPYSIFCYLFIKAVFR